MNGLKIFIFGGDKMNVRVLLLLIIFPLLINAQITDRCGVVQHMNDIYLQDISKKTNHVNQELILQQKLRQHSLERMAAQFYTIPVVVHILYNSADENISDAQVNSQIEVLNEDYSRINLDRSHTPGAFRSIASATNFQFCLAHVDPNGQTTTGIERRQTSVAQFQINDHMKHYSTGGLDMWDSDKYLNIWVCNLENNILGYAEMPDIQPRTNTFGAVIDYSVFGRYGSAVFPYNLGRTCTHEIGHLFNLYHTWGDDGGTCSGSDYVLDTPDQTDNTFGYPNFPMLDSCSPFYPGVMFMNYMDYTDDRGMNMFTFEQAQRMITSISLYFPGLLSSTVCLPLSTSRLNTFYVYPNPSGSFIIDMSELGMDSRLQLMITDVAGRAVYQKEYAPEDLRISQIEFDNHAEGIYFVTVTDGNIQVTRKIIII